MFFLSIDTTSRTTIFRILKAVGYFTSYSHAGRYCTPRRIPEFDRRGLWSWRGIGFSSHDTLRATSVFLIEQSEAGQTHEELQQQLGLRVHDTLRSLVEDGTITRERFEDVYVYLSADPKKAAGQMAVRRQRHVPTPAAVLPPDPLLVIDVLVEVIHHPREDAAAIAGRLRAAVRLVTTKQVEEVFHAYGVKKRPTGCAGRDREREAVDPAVRAAVPEALAECLWRTGRRGAAAGALLGLRRFDTRTNDMGTHGRDPRARPLPAAALRSMDEICSRPPLQSADCSQLVIHHAGVPGSSRVGGTYITIIAVQTVEKRHFNSTPASLPS